MSARNAVMVVLITLVMVMSSSLCYSKDYTPILVVYGVMWEPDLVTPVFEVFELTITNVSNGNTATTYLNMNGEMGKYSVVLLDYSTSNAAQVGDLIEISAKMEGEEDEYLYIHTVTQANVTERRARIDIVRISTTPVSWGAIKSLFR